MLKKIEKGREVCDCSVEPKQLKRTQAINKIKSNLHNYDNDILECLLRIMFEQYSKVTGKQK